MIHLFLSDAALTDAVVEQIAALRLGEFRLADSASAVQKNIASDENAILVTDRLADKKNAALLALAGKLVFLAIGPDEEIEGVSESFTIPLRLGHLAARLKYYLETAPLLRDRVVTFGPFSLEPRTRRLTRDGADPVRLTEKETALLVFLADQTQPSTRRDILAGVWGYDERIDTHTLETHIYQLRRKLEGDWLVSEAGAYRLVTAA